MLRNSISCKHTPNYWRYADVTFESLKYHIFNDAWADVKFISNIHIFKINPELADQARKGMGIKKHTHGDLYDASLMARYKYEINQKRSNVKTAVRKKYRGKCARRN